MSEFDPKPLGERAQAMIDALAIVTADPDRLTRLYLTPEHKEAAELVAAWMRRAGLTVRMDAAATMHGLMRAGKSGKRASRRLLVGSHIDTVIDGGRYDGTLGVVAAILAVEELRARGVTLPFGLEILAFGDEEGVRFPKTLVGSSTVAGSIEPPVLDMTDAAGETVRNALLRFGCDPAALTSEAYSRADVVGFIEVHIEQGPLLESLNEPLGVVTAIAAQSRHRVRIAGEAGHAGTVPMAFRHDALAAAAEFMAMVEEVAARGEKDQLVATVGEISVAPGAVNVIPREALMSLDVRAGSDEARAAAVETIRGRARQIGARRGVVIGVETVHEKPVAVCAPRYRKAIGAAISGLTGRKATELVSGAGHDGLAMAHLTEIGMIFVRCRAGISHNPLEHVTVSDLGYAVEALVRTIVEIAGGEPMIAAIVDANWPREVEFLKSLVRVPSDNPPGDCAPHAEAAAAALEGLGFKIERHPVPAADVRANGMKSAANLIVRQTFGAGRGPTVALNAHGDVVPPGEGWTVDPYGAVEKDGALYGRGVAVSKSDFATYAFALLALQESGLALDGNIELHFTYDEEAGGLIGPKWLIDQGLTKADFAISAGFSYAITVAHNGCLHLEVEVRGKQAHAAMPSTGHDALEATVPVLAAIYEERNRLSGIASAEKGIGSPQITVGLISGGINTNVVPDRIVFRVDRRIIPEENGETVEAELIRLVKSAAAGRPGISVECRRIMLAQPLRPLEGVDRLVGIVGRHARAVLGVEVGPTGVPLYTDARHYAAAGIPTILYGAGPRSILEANAHGADEHLLLSDLRAATEIVALTLADLLRPG